MRVSKCITQMANMINSQPMSQKGGNLPLMVFEEKRGKLHTYHVGMFIK